MLFKRNKQETKFSVPNNLYIGQDVKNRIKKIKRVQKDSILAVLTLVVLIAGPMVTANLVSASSVTPQPNSETNPSCTDFGVGWSELKLEGGDMSTGGTDGTLTVVISNFVQSDSGTPGSFDWSSNIGVDAVFVKAGSDKHNLYAYSPEETSDTDLSPQAGQGNGISHISFCYGELDDPDPEIDLAITKVADDTTPDEGQTVTYTIEITNNGPDDATNVVATDTVPAGTTFVSASPTEDSTSPLAWSLGNLASGDSTSIMVEVTVDAGTAGDTITNTATTSADETETDTTNNSDDEDITVNEPDPDPGILIVKKVVINDNGGTLEADDFSFSVNGDTAIQFEADGQNDLTVDADTYTVTEPAVAGYATTYDNCTNVVVDENETETCTITNDDPEPVQSDTLLTLVKEVVNDSGRTAVATDWTLTATGPTTIFGLTGSANVTNASVDAGTYTLSENGPGGYTASDWDCEGGTLAGNELTLVEGDEVACIIVNNDNPITTSSSSPNLQITKTVTPTITDPDTTVDYTILVQNVGNATAINVVLEDVLPTNFTYTDTGLAAQSWNLGNMTPGSSQTVTFSADVAAGTLPGNYTNRAEVSANNHGIRFDEATVTVRGVLGEEAAPVLEITKVGDKQTVNPGGTLNYTITITNTGEAPAVNLVVTDTLPAGFTLAEDGSSVINWDIDLLEVGETWETSFLVNVASDIEVPGNHMNEVSATAENYAGQLFASYTVVSAGQVLGGTGAGMVEVMLWLLAITMLAGSALVFKKELTLAKEEN